MIKKNALKQLIVTIAITLLFTFNNGMAQTSNDEINSLAFNDVVNMVTDALGDDEVSIALCKVPAASAYSALFPRSEENFRKSLRISIDMMSIQIQVIDILRGIDDIDSLFFLPITGVNRDGKGAYLPHFSPATGSEWILFLNSPFLMSHPFHDSMIERYEEICTAPL